MPPLAFDTQHASNLDYRTRLHLRGENTAEYNRLWSNAYADTVWDRLTTDAYDRATRRLRSKPYQEGTGVNHRPGSLSGFASNSSKAVYTPGMSFRAGQNPSLQPNQTTMGHPLLAKRFIHKQRIEYLNTIRPDTETTNQAQRMLGTYETDPPHAAKAQVFIAPICPAGQGQFFHPDVRLSDQAYATAQRAFDSLRTRDKVAEMRATRAMRPHSAHPALSTQQQQQQIATTQPAAAQNGGVKQRPISRPASASSCVQGGSGGHSSAAGQLRELVATGAATLPRPALIARPEDAITHRVAWGSGE